MHQRLQDRKPQRAREKKKGTLSKQKYRDGARKIQGRRHTGHGPVEDREIPEIGGLLRRNGDRARKNEKERKAGVDDGEEIEQKHDPYELRALGGGLSDCVHLSPPEEYADRARYKHEAADSSAPGQSLILL